MMMILITCVHFSSYFQCCEQTHRSSDGVERRYVLHWYANLQRNGIESIRICFWNWWHHADRFVVYRLDPFLDLFKKNTTILAENVDFLLVLLIFTLNVYVSHPIATFMWEISCPPIMFTNIILNIGLCSVQFLKWIWQFTV